MTFLYLFIEIASCDISIPLAFEYNYVDMSQDSLWFVLSNSWKRITRLIYYGTATPRVLGLVGCYCESYTNLKEYFWAFYTIFIDLECKMPL